MICVWCGQAYHPSLLCGQLDELSRARTYRYVLLLCERFSVYVCVCVMYVCMDGWMHVWMHACMHACIITYVCMYACISIQHVCPSSVMGLCSHCLCFFSFFFSFVLCADACERNLASLTRWRKRRRKKRRRRQQQQQQQQQKLSRIRKRRRRRRGQGKGMQGRRQTRAELPERMSMRCQQLGRGWLGGERGRGGTRGCGRDGYPRALFLCNA